MLIIIKRLQSIIITKFSSFDEDAIIFYSYTANEDFFYKDLCIKFVDEEPLLYLEMSFAILLLFPLIFCPYSFMKYPLE